MQMDREFPRRKDTLFGSQMSYPFRPENDQVRAWLREHDPVKSGLEQPSALFAVDALGTHVVPEQAQAIFPEGLYPGEVPLAKDKVIGIQLAQQAPGHL